MISRLPSWKILRMGWVWKLGNKAGLTTTSRNNFGFGLGTWNCLEANWVSWTFNEIIFFWKTKHWESWPTKASSCSSPKAFPPRKNTLQHPVSLYWQRLSPQNTMDNRDPLKEQNYGLTEELIPLPG